MNEWNEIRRQRWWQNNEVFLKACDLLKINYSINKDSIAFIKKKFHQICHCFFIDVHENLREQWPTCLCWEQGTEGHCLHFNTMCSFEITKQLIHTLTAFNITMASINQTIHRLFLCNINREVAYGCSIVLYAKQRIPLKNKTV